MYVVYIIQCRDLSLYTGITTNLYRRIWEHNHSVKAAKYTRGRRPVELVFSIEAYSRSKALKLEKKIKKMSKNAKLRLIDGTLLACDLE